MFQISRKEKYGKIQLREVVLSHITYLHYSCTRIEYEERMKYCLIYFTEYFQKQWNSSPFNNWQLHTRPAGYATCSYCEPLKKIKETVTGYKKMHILDSFKKVIEEICLYYLIHGEPFAFYPIFKERINVELSEILKNK